MKRTLAVHAFAILFVAFAATATMAADPAWKGWPEGTAKGLMPPCGTNVLAVGGDDVLQETVNTYCAVKPGQYVSYINPKVMDIYKKKGTNYPDGLNTVLAFPDIGVAFTTAHKGGKPVFDVVSMKDGKSAASAEKGHPLNPQVCFDCHQKYVKLCKGYVCGNRH